MNALILLHPDDTVAVVTKPVSKGEHLTYSLNGQSVTVKALDNIPVYKRLEKRQKDDG